MVARRLLPFTGMYSVPAEALSDTILTLREPSTAPALAAACRDAGLTFLNDAPHWEVGELTGWLLGPYTQLTRNSRRSLTPAPATRFDPALNVGIDPRMLARAVRAARIDILQTLVRARDPEAAASWVFTNLSAGFVTRCVDRFGDAAWAPTTKATRLADRVLSLFVADYLIRPYDYEGDLLVCGQCQRVEIGTGRAAGTVCELHQGSLVAPRPYRMTLPYFPEGA